MEVLGGTANSFGHLSRRDRPPNTVSCHITTNVLSQGPNKYTAEAAHNDTVIAKANKIFSSNDIIFS